MDLRAWTQTKKPLLGTLITIDNPTIVEIAALAGFDWLWIDAEHGRFNELSASLACSVAAGGPPTFIRLPDCAATTIKRYIDIGADAIILPQVSSLDEIDAIARAALYPPGGQRSVGIARAQQYGKRFPAYLKTKNDNIIVQIESAAGVRNAREIVNHPAVDGVIIGPYDMSASFGVPGEIESAQVTDGIRSVLSLTKEAGKSCGIFAATPQKASEYAEMGFDLVAVGIDSAILLNAFMQIRAAIS